MEGHEQQAIHARWSESLNRRTDDPKYQESWTFEQCGGCIHWLAIAGQIGADWGVCSSAESAFDGQVRFEHDGCECFVEDPEGFGIDRG